MISLVFLVSVLMATVSMIGPLFSIAHAADCTTGIDSLLGKINQYLINPIIVFMFALALAYFIFGVVQFMANQDSEEARSTGKQHMIYGVLGMFIMIAVFAIMRIMVVTLGGDTSCLPTT